MSGIAIIEQFLKSYYHTVVTSDLDRHMDLYSREVRLYGVPGREVLEYPDIALRRNNEFNRKLLVRVVFGTPIVLEDEEGEVVYRVRETMKATNGFALMFDVTVTLVLEADGRWRIREQRIANPEVIPPKTGEAPN
jgi:hypothetical protein